ncbi:alginate O-acetyltransferase [Capnocytophaga stomatis]|uniref:Membrane-bound O-acyltransferase family protein n=1 Tax=Capnocytophaga stomatis TaxID=1848904 RepID=A0A250FXS6_9FLAO|nr:MBOAT family O-acyltransferase [Capnocytophaga stomatis]ATA88888.1 membrane-bound O-acyltransferase family protein [Capnocytophaga stomatis]GIJ95688.1 alginate O-acetyltransferase [Capnocytophaga stomatis]
MNITNLQNWFFEHLNFTSEQVKSWFTYDPNNPLLFNSGLFLGMFLVFYLVYIITKKHSHFRTVYVILFSLFFYYKAGGNYFVLLVISSILDYFFAGQIHKSENPHKRKIFLIISMVANLGLLGYFKYTNFLIDSFNNLFEGSLAFQDIILPIGISFYTFQTMSYTIDVYRREIEPAKSFLDFTFFVCFFPQLVAGPIVRAKEFIPQIYKKIELTKQETSLALFLIIGGLLKKAVISDYISLNFVDRVFESPNSYTSFENLMAVYGYSLQIYCDFSGYSDMAIGLALLMGFTLPTNFRTPYQSQNITEFWRRWHISLSAWLKDYLYISVGGNRKGTFLGYFFPVLFFGSTLIWGFSQLKHSKIPLIIAGASVLIFIFTLLISRNKKKTVYSNFNQMTTMLLGGLWHGASLRFIVWGALHGLALAIHKTFVEFFSNKKSIENKETNWFSRIFFTFLTFHFVAFCWIFFRSKDFGIAMDVINNIGSLTFDWHQWLVIAEGYRNVFLLLFIGFVWHFFPQSLNEKLKLFFGKMPILVKSLIVAFVFWIVYATASSGAQPFIYFQF